MTPETVTIIYNSILWGVLIMLGCFVVYRQYASRNSLIDSLKSFNSVRDEFETVIADFVAGIVPWLAGIPPAYLSAYHAYHVLDLPVLVCVTLGIVVEGVAFANVATYTEVSQFQREKEGVKKYEKGVMPKRNIILVIGFYLVVVVFMNGILGFFDMVPVQELYTAVSTGNTEQLIVAVVPAVANSIAIFLISLLTIPGAATISLRLQHRQFVRENDPKYKKEKDSNPPNPQPAVTEPIQKPELTKDLEEFYLITERVLQQKGSVTKTALANLTGLSRPTVYKRISDLVELGLLRLDKDNNVIL